MTFANGGSSTPPADAAPQPKKRVNLALQGGGAHGAFTWGVIDRLLAEDQIEIVAVTGASAGAMNAVALSEGLCGGCKEEARRTLRSFWENIGDVGRASPIQRTMIDKWMGGWSLDNSPTFLFFDMLSRVASPYDLNPFDINPLRDVLARLVNFDKVRACAALKVFISATNVTTGQIKIFQKEEIDVDHVMASACLPFMFKAVDIDGALYWDGGYMGNPPLWPLFDQSDADDVVIVQINPFRREETPRSAREIMDRLNEITFNASLLRELRAIDFVTRLLEDGRLEGTGYRNMHIHMIGDEIALAELGASSKLNAERAFLEMLFEMGFNAADRWLKENLSMIGVRSSVDIRSIYSGHDVAPDADGVDPRYARRTDQTEPNA